MGALVLSRREGEIIVLTLPSGETVEITNLGHYSPYCRLRVEAPRSIRIDRKEKMESLVESK